MSMAGIPDADLHGPAALGRGKAGTGHHGGGGGIEPGGRECRHDADAQPAAAAACNPVLHASRRPAPRYRLHTAVCAMSCASSLPAGRCTPSGRHEPQRLGRAANPALRSLGRPVRGRQRRMTLPPSSPPPRNPSRPAPVPLASSDAAFASGAGTAAHGSASIPTASNGLNQSRRSTAARRSSSPCRRPPSPPGRQGRGAASICGRRVAGASFGHAAPGRAMRQVQTALQARVGPARGGASHLHTRPLRRLQRMPRRPVGRIPTSSPGSGKEKCEGWQRRRSGARPLPPPPTKGTASKSFSVCGGRPAAGVPAPPPPPNPPPARQGTLAAPPARPARPPPSPNA